MRFALLLALAAACSNDKSPSKPLLDQVRRFCAIGELPTVKEQSEAHAVWAKGYASNRELLDLIRMATDGEEKARAMLRAAIDATVGPDKCTVLVKMMEVLPAKAKP